ncbi:epidermis-specific secreted glycoprotein EP1-like [Mangifera indica]|uniref:epidermis-specific secreted glycoprotein EP1-like n=1 Tax=Mangifera indica TaxID=29780 RepID=UPI001CFB034A|nr:epidermis-specific secreted glycoprotein EP1-like [Mangifera indica]
MRIYMSPSALSLLGEYVQMLNNTNISWTIDGSDDDPSAIWLSSLVFETEVDWVPLSILVWSFNRNKPVRSNATMLLTRDGDMMLQDFDGTLVWSTNTKGKSVAGFKADSQGILCSLTQTTLLFGNLLIFQLTLGGQKFYSNSDQKLTASASSTNWTGGGLYSLSLTNEGLSAFLESDPALVYTKNTELFREGNRTEPLYATLSNEGFIVLREGSNIIRWIANISLSQATPMQHVTLEFDGHLRVYDFVESSLAKSR